MLLEHQHILGMLRNFPDWPWNSDDNHRHRS
jgi:hypothetical protein